MNPATTASAMRGESRWIPARPRAAGARFRLFCLPFAGGGASTYGAWPGLLGSAIDVIAIQLPGRESRLREPAVSSIDCLAREIVRAIGDWLDLPYALFGHSMGALVAFEVARGLRRQGLPAPQLMFPSAKRAPQLGPDPEPMGRLSDADLLGRLHGQFGLDLSAEMRPLIELMLPTIRADICAVDDYSYAPESPFRFPIVALGGDSDASVRQEELSAWGIHTESSFRTRLFPGGHFFVDDCRRQVAMLLQEELSRLS